MKISRRKLAALMLAVAAPGSLMLGCSNRLSQQIRDAAVSGATDFVTQQTFDILAFLFPATTTN